MAAETSSAMPAPGRVFSSIKTLVMRLLIMAGLMDEYVLDHSTTPEVVRISKVSNILGIPSWRQCYDILWKRVGATSSICRKRLSQCCGA